MGIFTTSSLATVYYVSMSGDDNKSGTSPEEAWRTLDKVNSFTPRAGDQILFNRGDHWIGTIKVNASGTSGSPVVYGAYGTGEKPRLYSSEEITGWTKYSGNIYKASFGKEIKQVFIDGKRAKLARYPNSGYFKISSVSSSTKFSSSSLNPGINYTGGSWIGRTSAFTMYSRKIIASSSQTLTLSSRPSYNPDTGEGFFLADKLEFLDSAGEWYYDPSSNTVYLWTPSGDSPDNHSVRGATYDYGVTISSKNYTTIKNLTILHSAVDGVYISNSDYVTVDNNNIISPDLVGIHIPSGSSNATQITNNYIYQANGGGIRCYSPSATISDNKIEDIGLLENINKSTYPSSDNFGTGIYSRSDNPTIIYNRIINSGYAGINWKGQNGDISYNYINGACLVLDDAGGIYTYNGSDYSAPGSKGSEVLYNIILNVHGNREGYTKSYDAGSGIYMDDGTHDVNIQHNTINGCTYGIFLHINGRINVQNNQFSDCLIGLLAGKQHEKSYLYNNTVYAFNRTGDVSWWNDSHQRMTKNDAASPVYNENKYIHHYASDKQFNNSYSFPEWKSATGQDTNSSFDGTSMLGGETEQLFYNDTKQAKLINLGTTIYKDIEGTQVSGTITLQPFTSKILIKTGSERSSINQSPDIQGQTLEINGDIQADEFVGQVVANDPDVGQTLGYSITGGNEEDLFSIDQSTGEIFAKTDIQTTQNKSVDLVVSVTDNAASSLSASATVTINIIAAINNNETNSTPDTTAPIISFFSVPETTATLTVPVLTFVASDNTAVTGYLVTESENLPAADNNIWLTSPPDSYTFSDAGTYTLYAWTKDAAGNISSPVSRAVTITSSTTNNDSVEYVTICEGDSYMGWTESGTYQRTFTSEANLTLSGSNQISNSDFSNGIDGWTTWAATGYNLELAENNQEYLSAPASLQANCTANGTSTTSLHLITGGDIFVQEGKTYELTFFAKATVEFLVGRIYIQQSISPWTNYGSFEIISPMITRNWTKYTIKFTATSTASNGRLRFYLGNSLPAGQSLFLDDVAFSEILTEQNATSRNITTYLTVNPIKHTTESITINQGENYMGWTESGQYIRNLSSAAGCDSIVTTNLSVTLSTINTVEDITICEGENYLGWTEEGQYQRTLTTPSGADSLVTTNLWINPIQYTTEEVTINAGENYLGWTETGQYERTLTSSTGCDSVVTTILTVHKIVNQTLTQTINLEKGWNIFSSYIMPGDSSFDALPQMLSQSNMLSEVKDELNNTYTRKGNTWINNIGNLKKTEGYKINVKNSCVLEISGQAVKLPMDIQLYEGWNIISFPINRNVDAMEIIGPLIDSGILEKVQDEKGNSIEYWGNSVGWINGIGNFKSGEGYLVQVNSNGVLPILESYQKSEILFASDLETTYFTVDYEGNGSGHMNINIEGLVEANFEVGDEIAAFDGDVCVGAIKIGGNNMDLNAISLKASVSDEDILNGFIEGNPIELRVWHADETTNTTYNSMVIKGNMFYQSHESVFVQLVNQVTSSNIESFESTDYNMYPNPAIDKVVLSFSQLPENGTHVILTDITGKELINREVQTTNEVLNVQSIPSGMYFVNIVVGDNRIVEKLIVN